MVKRNIQLSNFNSVVKGNGKLSIRTIGDFGHLDKENLTFN